MKKSFTVLIGLVFTNLFSQNDWQLLNPLPTIYQGSQIDFVDDNHGFILTSKYLLETFDFGDTWIINSELTLGTAFDFLGNIGVIADGFPALSRISFDGGTTWESLNTPGGGYNTVKIFESGRIYLTGSSKLSISDDWGINWAILDLPYGQVAKSFFVNEQVGYICSLSGKISKTTDGGETWELLYNYGYTPGDFKNIYFVNDDLGFAYREPATLLRTDDGGNSWTETEYYFDIYDFHFVNDQVGFMAGDMGKIYKTTNGGNTWTPKNYTNTGYGLPWYFGIYFKSENEGIACGQRGMIIKTTNSGSTWLPYSFLYDPIYGGQLFGDIGYIHTLKNLYKTIDGGVNWDYSNKPVNSGQIRSCHFFDENLGVMLAGDNKNKLYKTEDGGENWGLLNDQNLDFGFIEFTDPLRGFAFSNNASHQRMMITIDGGQTFQDLEYGTNFYDIYFVSENVGYSRRFGWNKIFKTVDGGYTWQIYYDNSDSILDFQFTDEDTAYMVTSECCAVYKTNDGGAEWSPTSSSPVNDILYMLAFYSSEAGYVIDEDNIVYYTANGGDSWSVTTKLSGYNIIKDISIIDGNVLLFGENGVIAKTTTGQMNTIDFPVNSKYSIQIYPNPTEDIVHIKIDDSLTVSRVEIYDLNGNLILNKITDKKRFSVKDIAKGIYIMKVFTNQNEVFSNKLILK